MSMRNLRLEAIVMNSEIFVSSACNNVEQRLYHWVRVSYEQRTTLIIQLDAISLIAAIHTGTFTKAGLNVQTSQRYV